MLCYQLYSSRNFPPLPVTLRMLSDLGYEGVEGYGALFADAAEVEDLARGLHDTGLAMPTAHFGLDRLEADPRGVVSIARMLGIRRIFCPYVEAGHRPSDAAGWRAFGTRLQAAGAPVRAAGLGFGWHNHDFELHPLPDGQVPLDLIFAGGPDLDWEIDVAWVVRGGADPTGWINRHSPRITSAHVKDIAPRGRNADQDGWADVGQGTMNWRGIMAALRGTPCETFVLEHDNPSDHARFARVSLAAVKGY